MKHVVAAISLAFLSGLAFSQAASSADDKARESASQPPAVTQVPGLGAGPGGQGPRGRMMQFDRKNTPGWSLMTSEERHEHRNKMHGFKTVDECRAYHEEHVKRMEARAKEQGKTFKPLNVDPCAMMQQRGFLK